MRNTFAAKSLRKMVSVDKGLWDELECSAVNEVGRGSLLELAGLTLPGSHECVGRTEFYGIAEPA